MILLSSYLKRVVFIRINNKNLHILIIVYIFAACVEVCSMKEAGLSFFMDKNQASRLRVMCG